MPALLLGLALLGGLLLVGWWYSGAQPGQVAGALRTVGLVIAGAAIVYLLLVGRAAVAAGLLMALLGLWLKRPGWRPGSGRVGRQSGVRTPWLAMTLRHDTGQAEGEVLQGSFTGRPLGSLLRAEALALRRELAGDAQSLALLEAWLDRQYPGWRDGGQGATAGPMTRSEALEILDLKEDATAAEIAGAHRRLMLKLHPDQGGSTWMAAKLNQAKDLLLG